MTRCVRGALLLGEESFDRKLWIERRIEKLAEIFAVSVGGFAVMDNHSKFSSNSISSPFGLGLGRARQLILPIGGRCVIGAVHAGKIVPK